MKRLFIAAAVMISVISLAATHRTRPVNARPVSGNYVDTTPHKKDTTNRPWPDTMKRPKRDTLKSVN